MYSASCILNNSLKFTLKLQLAELYKLLDVDGNPLRKNYRIAQDVFCRKINYVYQNADTEYSFKPCANGTYALTVDICVGKYICLRTLVS